MAVKASATITLSFMVDIKSAWRYYKLQASTASKPSKPSVFPPSSNSGWTDAEPNYTNGSTNTLYFVDCTVFTDDSFSYSEVSKSSSYEAAKEAYNKAVAAGNVANNANNKIDNLEIGGRNLIRGSLSIGKTSSPFIWGWIKHEANPELIQLNEETVLHATQSSGKQSVPSIALSKSILLEWGETYTYSGEIRINAVNNLYSTSGPLHYHVGSVETIGSTSILNKGGGVVITRITPTAVTNAAANTWIPFEYRIVTNASAPNSSYPYPVIRPFIYGEVSTSNNVTDVWVRKVKLEKGNKVTDWAQAPEDIDDDIDKVEDSIANVNNTVSENSANISKTSAELEILKNAIKSLVVGENGSTLLEQTDSGFTFNLNTVVNNISDISSRISSVENTSASIEQINNLTAQINELNRRTGYVKINNDAIDYDDSSGNTKLVGIEIGDTDNKFKVQLTNKALNFIDGSTRVAYISNNTLTIETGVFLSELRLGRFKWIYRSNGHLSLIHV